jgi:hypothetical protein
VLHSFLSGSRKGDGGKELEVRLFTDYSPLIGVNQPGLAKLYSQSRGPFPHVFEGKGGVKLSAERLMLWQILCIKQHVHSKIVFWHSGGIFDVSTLYSPVSLLAVINYRRCHCYPVRCC